MKTTKIEIEHECLIVCAHCHGSGEGMADGSNCIVCRGSGISYDGGTRDLWFEIEWEASDLSDLDVIDGDYTECPYCGRDLYEDIKEEVLWLIKNGEIS